MNKVRSVLPLWKEDIAVQTLGGLINFDIRQFLWQWLEVLHMKSWSISSSLPFPVPPPRVDGCLRKAYRADMKIYGVNSHEKAEFNLSLLWNKKATPFERDFFCENGIMTQRKWVEEKKNRGVETGWSFTEGWVSLALFHLSIKAVPLVSTVNPLSRSLIVWRPPSQRPFLSLPSSVSHLLSSDPAWISPQGKK